MKILQFMASEKWGGAEKVFVELSNELAERNHNVIAVLLRGTEYRNKFIDAVKIIELRANPTRRNPLLLWELHQVIKTHVPDIVHSHAAKASEIVKSISHFSRFLHLATKHNARKGRVFNSLPWVTVVSREAKESVKPKKQADIRVIHNGIVFKTIQGTQKRNPDFSIAAIGRLDKIKGFDFLIKQVKDLSFSYHLTIAGEGPELSNLETLVALYDLQEKIELIGFCKEIPQLMTNSDLVVISSHSEGFPQVMLEALIYANVLISTPVGGVVELLPPFFLTEQNNLGKKIEDVKKNYQSYHSEFEQLRKKRMEEFHLSNIVRQYENVYEEMIGAHPQSAGR